MHNVHKNCQDPPEQGMGESGLQDIFLEHLQAVQLVERLVLVLALHLGHSLAPGRVHLQHDKSMSTRGRTTLKVQIS